ncbi:Domain of unknown function DUF4189 [Mycobacteriaceae bacterium]
MASTRLVTTMVAAGVIAAGISAATAFAGGPGGTIEDTAVPFRAIGTGTFEDFADGPAGDSTEVGFSATGATAEEASAAVIAVCQAAGGVDCSSDVVTNDAVCIVSVGDDAIDVVSGGAGVTIDAARQDALQRAAASNLPIDPASPVIISACP